MSDRGATLSLDERWLVESARQLLELSPAAADAACANAWQVNCLKQQRLLRQRSRHRFPDPSRWLWTERSLAQSSDWWSAKFKASLFLSGEPLVDACCGAGVDTVALAPHGQVTCIDADPLMSALTVSNAAADGQRVSAMTAPVDQPLLSRLAQEARWLHVDPDRRPAERRTTTADEFSPALDELLESTPLFAGAMIKLAPSTRMSPHTEQRVEAHCHRMWVGNRGECRQQLLLTGGLCDATAPRRTAVLAEPPNPATASSDSAGASDSCSGSCPAARPGLEVGTVWRPSQENIFKFSAEVERNSFVECEMQPGTYIADLHAVLHASELQWAWGALHGLRPLGGLHGYFTGDSPLVSRSENASENTVNASPWAQYFRVIELLPWDDRQVRKWLRAHDCGIVEVKNRMVRLDANAFQRRYSGTGSRPFTLLVTQLGDRVRVVIAERLETAASLLQAKLPQDPFRTKATGHLSPE